MTTNLQRSEIAIPTGTIVGRGYSLEFKYDDDDVSNIWYFPKWHVDPSGIIIPTSQDQGFYGIPLSSDTVALYSLLLAPGVSVGDMILRRLPEELGYVILSTPDCEAHIIVCDPDDPMGLTSIEEMVRDINYEFSTPAVELARDYPMWIGMPDRCDARINVNDGVDDYSPVMNGMHPMVLTSNTNVARFSLLEVHVSIMDYFSNCPERSIKDCANAYRAPVEQVRESVEELAFMGILEDIFGDVYVLTEKGSLALQKVREIKNG